MWLRWCSWLCETMETEICPISTASPAAPRHAHHPLSALLVLLFTNPIQATPGIKCPRTTCTARPFQSLPYIIHTHTHRAGRTARQGKKATRRCRLCVLSPTSKEEARRRQAPSRSEHTTHTDAPPPSLSPAAAAAAPPVHTLELSRSWRRPRGVCVCV